MKINTSDYPQSQPMGIRYASREEREMEATGAPIGQVVEELERAKVVVMQLQENTRELMKGVNPVLSPAVPVVDGSKEMVDKAEAPLAEQIRDLRYDMEIVLHLVFEMKARLQL